jgi:hypothetical protein
MMRSNPQLQAVLEANPEVRGRVGRGSDSGGGQAGASG